MYFSLVYTRLFNKKVDPTRSSEFDRTADVVCTPDDISVFLTGRSLLGRDVFYPEVVILSFRFCDTSGYRVTVCYVINGKEFHTTELDINLCINVDPCQWTEIGKLTIWEQ